MSTVLDPKIIQKVSEQIYKRFPEVMGARPNIKKQPGRKNTTDREKSTNGSINFLLTYHGSVEVSEGRKMERWVRVVVNDRGKILKMTTSR
jgi:hypothetical protein